MKNSQTLEIENKNHPPSIFMAKRKDKKTYIISNENLVNLGKDTKKFRGKSL